MALAGVLVVPWLFWGWGIPAVILSKIAPALATDADGNMTSAAIGLMIVFEIIGIIMIKRLAGLKSVVSVTFGAKALKFHEKLYEYDSILSFGLEGPGRRYVTTTSTGLNAAAQSAGHAIGGEISARSFGIYILYFGKKVFLFRGLKEAEAESVFLEAKRILADRGVYFS